MNYRHRRNIRITLLIVIIIACVYALSDAADLTQDGAGTWRISTFSAEDHTRHYMYGSVFQWEKGLIYRSFYGFVESTDCSTNIVKRKEYAKWKLGVLLDKTLYATQGKPYSISIAISVCNPDQYVIYLHDGTSWANKEVYKEVLNELH